MANSESPEKKGLWDKVVEWYASNAYAVGIIYSVGASVVIVGALFKILHWPGASQVLMVGMFTEAFLFILGIFEKPHPTYHWENVFPQLVGHEAKELVGGSGVAAPEKAEKASVPAISDEDMKALKEGIDGLGKTAQQLASLGKIAEAGEGLSQKMQKAGDAAEKLAGVQDKLQTSVEGLGSKYDKLGANVDELGSHISGLGAKHDQLGEQLAASFKAVTAEVEKVGTKAQELGKGVDSVSAQLSSLNAAYELQLNAVKSQADELKAQTEAIKAQKTRIGDVNSAIEGQAKDAAELQKATAEALAESKKYAEAQKKLAEQVANLNSVYGNMLNAVA